MRPGEQLTEHDARQVDLFRRYLEAAPPPGELADVAELEPDVLAFAFPSWLEWWHPSYACRGMGE